MKTILKSSIFENNVLVKTFKKDFENIEFKETTINVNNDYETGIHKEINLDGILLILRDLKTKDYKIAVSHDFPLFKLQFEIEGSSLYAPFKESERTIYIPGGHYNLFYLPDVNGTLYYKTNKRKTVEILFTEKYVQKIIGIDYKEYLLCFGKAINEKKPFLMWKDSKPITTELQNCTQEIINCNYCGNLKKAYLEAKINELLIIMLAKTNQENYQNENIELPKNEYQSIIKLEKFIVKNLNKTLTISQLALMAGMNTSKLKQKFKIVFGTTIFKYITKLRMETAKKLILENDFTIYEAAQEVGYKHPQHFTVAFKKLYGFLPSKLL